MKYKIFIVLLFLLKSYALQSMQSWGRWYANQAPQQIGIIDAEIEQLVRTGVAGRNLLLSDRRDLYVNNMYPVNEYGDKLQLGSVLVSKGIIDGGDLDYVRRSPLFRESPIPYWEALGRFVQGVIIYLNAFGADVAVLNHVYGDYLAEGLVRNYHNLNLAKNTLKNGEMMAGVWEYMHTEFLYMFKGYYDVDSRSFVGPFLSFVLVSHYDMCESCEKMMIVKSQGTMEADDPYQDVPYTVLVGSFFPYPGSRYRIGEENLLKVVLQ